MILIHSILYRYYVKIGCFGKSSKKLVIVLLILTVLFSTSTFAATKKIKKENFMQNNSKFYMSYDSANSNPVTLYWEDPDQ